MTSIVNGLWKESITKEVTAPAAAGSGRESPEEVVRTWPAARMDGWMHREESKRERAEGGERGRKETEKQKRDGNERVAQGQQ